VFQTTNFGRKAIQINDADIALIVLTESDFFSKIINESHPLYPIKSQTAGVFLSDTDNPVRILMGKKLPTSETPADPFTH
jgi:hypothetical protein